MLERYNAVIPNGAERIMAMVEKQAEHRRQLERDTIQADIRAQDRGQKYPLAVVLAGMILGAVFIYLGKPIEGLASIFGPLAIVAGIFLSARRRREEEWRARLAQMNSAATQQR